MKFIERVIMQSAEVVDARIIESALQPKYDKSEQL